jgi:hypothetical protein
MQCTPGIRKSTKRAEAGKQLYFVMMLRNQKNVCGKFENQ